MTTEDPRIQSLWDSIENFAEGLNRGDIDDYQQRRAAIQKGLCELLAGPFVLGRGPWMQTRSGKAFYPFDPRPEDFELEDIAWGLSHECRYNGQCDRFWSVAQHSLCVAAVVEEEARKVAPENLRDQLTLLALLHDAEEGLIKDIPTPLKLLLRDYEGIKLKVRAAINKKFDLSRMVENCQEWLFLIKRVDVAVLHAEKLALLGPPPMPWDTEVLNIPPASIAIAPVSVEQARSRWLKAFELYQTASMREADGIDWRRSRYWGRGK